MKFPRHARISRNQLDAAPFAGVFLCLLIFILLASRVYTPGALINLPSSATMLPGVDGPKIAVAMDANGWLYFQNQLVPENILREHLKNAVAQQAEPLTLIVQADKSATLEQMGRLRDLALSAGIRQIQQQVLPRVFDSATNSPSP